MQTNKSAGASRKPRKTGNRPQRRSTYARPEASSSEAVATAVADGLIQQASGASLDQAITRALKAAPALAPNARREVVQTLGAINRHRARLSWHLATAGAEPTPAALFSASDPP